ncbi:FadR/GntR family transcriptional regulator [Corynebacterium ureicelerivorans]
MRELAGQIVELAGQDAGNSEAFQEADLEFHALMLEASRNEMFIALTQPIMGIMSGRALYGIMPDDPHVDTMQIHVELAAAISRGDADAAEDASRRLLRGVNDFMEM